MGSVAIAAGGTGGHLYPAIAVARELVGLAPGIPVHFVGSATGLESRVVPREGFPFTAVDSGPWHRGRPISLLLGMVASARGALKARGLLGDMRAGAVFSTGGFASAPVMMAATLSGIPTVVHEPNRMPGIVNRVFGRIASRVTLGFEDARGFFPSSRVIVTGVPVRRDLVVRNREQARRSLDITKEACVVLAFGGSQGASGINCAMAEAMPHLSSSTTPLLVLWMCGSRGRAECESAVRSVSMARPASLEVRLFDYLDDIGDALAAADIVVARAGASTVAELMATEKPSILVPYPHSAAEHQEKNAAALARADAAIVMSESSLTGKSLSDAISGLATDPSRRADMGRRIGAQGRPSAARDVAEQILAVMRS